MLRTSYGIICIVISIFCLYIMSLCRKKQGAMAGITGKVCLTGAMLVFFNSLTLFCNAPLLCSAALSGMLICADLFVYFVLEYTMQLTEAVPIKKQVKIGLLAFVIVDSVLLASNPWTKIVLSYEPRTFFREFFHVINPNVWYYVHCLYIYLTVAAVLVVLIRKCMRVPFVYAGRYLMELSVVFSVVAVNLLYLLIWVPMDLSCFLYAWAAYTMYRGALEYKPRLLRKQARFLMTNKIQEPVLLFDIIDRLADFNEEAAEKLNISENDLCKLTREHFETSILHLTYEENPTAGVNREFVLQKDYADITYLITVQTLYSKHGLSMGTFYLFQDISKQKMMYNALENMSAYDQLTGFYTNRTFAAKLAEWDKVPEEYVVAICNIAGMKLINAFYNRTVGNGVIQRMSEEVRNVLPEDALVCYSDDDSTVIIARGITEEQMNLYLSNAARKLKKRGLENIPVYLNFGVSRRENTAVSTAEYIKYAVMDLLMKKGKESVLQKREMTEAFTKVYFGNEYESKEHVKRIGILAGGMAEKLGLGVEDKEKLELLCCYHDIGRVKTREEVWSRAAVITRDEMDIIKLHSVTGYQIVSQMELGYDIADLVLYHHENYDGTGYPYGLKGEKIPLLSRILAIVDSYDIMINDQRYKGAVSEAKASEELRINAGSQFDPVLVKVFEEYLKESK